MADEVEKSGINIDLGFAIIENAPEDAVEKLLAGNVLTLVVEFELDTNLTSEDKVAGAVIRSGLYDA